MNRIACVNTLRCTLAALTFAALFGCSGGGGGSDPKPATLTYSGSTTPALITQQNATQVVGFTFGSDDLSGQLPDTSLSAQTATYRSAAKLLQPQVAVNESDGCFPEGSSVASGSVHYSGDLNDNNGTGTIDIDFRDCQDGDTFMDGQVRWVIRAADVGPDYWMPTDSTMTFSAVTLRDASAHIALGGDVRIKLSLSGVTTQTFDMVIQDQNSARMFKTENVVVETWFELGYDHAERLSGRFFDSVEGYVDISTPQPLLFANAQDEFPASGEIRVSGANGVQLKITALSTELAQLALDEDGDNLFETVGELPWSVAASAGQDPGDADGDGIADSWENSYGLNSATFADASQDNDGDTLTNYREYQLLTDPTDSDTDNDLMEDGWEIAYGFNPLAAADASSDADGDLATNQQEHQYGTDPKLATSTPADLAVSQQVSATVVSAQTLYEYQVTVTQQGPGIARGATLSATMPTGASIYSAVPGMLSTPWDCGYNGQNLNCTPFDSTMHPASSVTIRIPVLAPASSGTISAQFTLQSDTLDYVASNDTGAVDTEVAPALLSQVALAVDGSDGVEGMERPFRLAVSPDGQHIYVPAIVDDAVAIFSRNASSGEMSFIAAQRDGIDTPEGPDLIPKPDFPKAVAVSPDGKHLYIATEWSQGEWIGSVIAMERDEASGQLTHLATYRDGEGGIDGIAQAIALVISADGGSVYVAGPNDNAIGVFQRDTSTGLLTFNTFISDGVDGVDGLAGPFDLALSPDNQFLYVAGSLDNAIAIFARDSAGALTYVGKTEGVGNPLSLGVSPDGKHLYCISAGIDPGLMLFTRDPLDGTLTLQSHYRDGDDGIVLLEGLYSLAISPSGELVIVTAQYDSSLGVFARDAESGALQWQETHKDGQGGKEGLGTAWALAFSPDGEFVYVAASSDNAVTGFKVEASNIR